MHVSVCVREGKGGEGRGGERREGEGRGEEGRGEEGRGGRVCSLFCFQSHFLYIVAGHVSLSALLTARPPPVGTRAVDDGHPLTFGQGKIDILLWREIIQSYHLKVLVGRFHGL